MKARFLLCLLLILRVGGLSGQSNDYAFSHLDISAGLSNNHITCIYKDARGYMWFGTASGLNRWDGYQVKVFKHDEHDSNSLSDNYIEQMFQGPDGKLWVESRAGRFNIYDFGTSTFSRSYLEYLRGSGLPDSWLQHIICWKGEYWFIYRDKGVYHRQADGKVIAFKPISGDVHSISDVAICSAQVDGDGNCWVVHEDGRMEKIDGHLNKVVLNTGIVQQAVMHTISLCHLFIDKDNDCWLSSNGVFKGVIFYSPLTGELKHLTQDGGGPSRLSSNVIQSVIQDDRGDIWMATDHGGVDILHKKDFSIKTITHVEDDRKSLPDNNISTVYQDYSGTIWIGTFKSAVSYYHQERIQFPQYRRQPGKPGSLSFDDVGCFTEDKKGVVWIGTNGGGVIRFDRATNTFRQYLHDPRQPNSVSSNIIVSLITDRNGDLWLGTYFGGLDRFDGKTFTHYRHDPSKPTSLADDRVMCIYEDSGNDLWIGTLGQGMDRLDRSTGQFYHYNSGRPGGILNNYVSSITEDSRHKLWIGTGYGIDVMDKGTGNFTHYSSDGNGLSSDNVNWLLCDSRGHMWAGTREGLSVFDPARRKFQAFTAESGLPDNTIQCIVEDRQHDIWVTTLNGVCRLSGDWSAPPGALHPVFNNFYESDGLQGRDFNEKAGFLTGDGTILLGGHNGLNMFDPAHIVHRKTVPPIVLTDLQLFNRIVRPGEEINGHVVLEKSLSATNEITLHPHDNVFSIEFASLDFFQHTKDRYAYKLDGFDKNWLVTDGKSRKATYTNLDAGEYTFRVKAADEDGDWNRKEATLKIIVLPPFWKTGWAYFCYVLCGLLLLYLARQMVLRRARMRFSLEQERAHARNMHEVDRMKIRFLTNMSHELRTPLSLILAPVEKLLEQSSSRESTGKAASGPLRGGVGPIQAGRMSGSTARDTAGQLPIAKQSPVPQYEMIQRNARRLLHLVNQLLDFRKMETNELKLNARPGDILRFVREISLSFVDLADRKHIGFDYMAPSGVQLETLFDHDKLERILFNLLSNAFKFTQVDGRVWVEVKTEEIGGDDVEIYIKVCDTGIGIAADMRERIFDRFFQSAVPDSILNQGSGIGLAITQEFVKMHGGRLTVESEVDRGSCFTVMLPCKLISMISLPVEPENELAFGDERSGEDAKGPGDEAMRLRQTEVEAAAPTAATIATATATTTAAKLGLKGKKTETGLASVGDKRKTILIVEDNEDFRFYLKDNLRGTYIIHEAADGAAGWKKALALHPDIVVSDISMPVMNGIDLCKKIRTDARTQQIPVILLTALSEEHVQLQGLDTGASDFLTKPFNFEVLQSRIRNLLANQETLKHVYQRQVDAGPVKVEVQSADDEFLQTVLREMEKHLADPEFNVEAMSQLLNTSRSTFYKRLLLITGKTPVEFMRSFRLRRGAELLEKSQLNVSEIAYTVGFNNPKYFAQQFKQEFDVAPSAYRAQRGDVSNRGQVDQTK